jgi:predicted RNA-binding Zn-ribbon protein involved in translation (DUF1610 family)
MTEKKNKERFIRVCPRCGSKNIDIDTGVVGIAPFYICKSCGFGSPLFPEVSQTEAETVEEKPINYSPNFSPTKKPVSAPLLLLPLAMAAIIMILLILLSR